MNKLESLQKVSIDYQINYAKTNRLTLKFNRDGILIVRCPKNMTIEELNSFIMRHMKWIIKNRTLVCAKVKGYQTGDEYLYLGKTYVLKVVISKHEGVFLQEENKTIIIYTNSEEGVKNLLNNWKKNQAEMIFSELFYICFKDMSKDIKKFPSLKFKNYLSRWGCCYPKRNEIILNIALIHVDILTIKYVIYHELSHLLFPNHQKEFHDYLQKYCPEEHKFRNNLKKYRTDYE